jgi:hypothetical protein
VASVALLDSTQEDDSSSELIFMGETHDISGNGLALVLPSIRIDEKCCEESKLLKLYLHLPATAVEMVVDPVRCIPLDSSDPDQGYLMGLRISRLGDAPEAELTNYLQNLWEDAAVFEV